METFASLPFPHTEPHQRSSTFTSPHWSSKWLIGEHTSANSAVKSPTTVRCEGETLRVSLSLTAEDHRCWGAHHREEGGILGILGGHPSGHKQTSHGRKKTRLNALQFKRQSFQEWPFHCQRLETTGESKREVTNPGEEQITGGEEENGDPEAVTWPTMSARTISAF